MRNLSVFFFFLLLLSLLLLLPSPARGDCSCDEEELDGKHSRSIPLKIIAIFSILIAGAVGVCLPTLGKRIPALGPEKNFFFAIKAFAAGVILATGFIHILPDAFENLTSPCLNPSPWQDFPFAGFFAMVAAIGTLVVDAAATAYYSRINGIKEQKSIVPDEEDGVKPSAGEHCVHVHTHAAHGHAHGAHSSSDKGGGDLIRHKVISQVLELGIVVHSVIIGISLGASSNSSAIKPLVVALSFHQFFEGMGLGGCLIQAQFKIKSMIVMIMFFSLTTPLGIAVGIGISSVYNEKSPTALIVEGILNSGAAGILIYMALVDLLAADFMNSKVQNNGKLQIIINVSLLLGAGLMSLLAKWA